MYILLQILKGSISIQKFTNASLNFHEISNNFEIFGFLMELGTEAESVTPSDIISIVNKIKGTCRTLSLRIF